MKQIVLAATLAVSPIAALADDKAEGLSLMERGARMLMESLIDDMQPAIDDMATLMDEFGPQMQDLAREYGPQLRALLEEMGPRLENFLSRVDDFTYYEAPEILPNGDIIIRRKPDAPAYVPEDVVDL